MTRRAPATPDEVARWLSIQGSTAVGQGVIALLRGSDDGRAVLGKMTEMQRAHVRSLAERPLPKRPA